MKSESYIYIPMMLRVFCPGLSAACWQVTLDWKLGLRWPPSDDWPRVRSVLKCSLLYNQQSNKILTQSCAHEKTTESYVKQTLLSYVYFTVDCKFRVVSLSVSGDNLRDIPDVLPLFCVMALEPFWLLQSCIHPPLPSVTACLHIDLCSLCA